MFSKHECNFNVRQLRMVFILLQLADGHLIETSRLSVIVVKKSWFLDSVELETGFWHLLWSRR